MQRFTREMGISHQEFFRSLPPALAGAACEIDGTRVRIDLGRGRVELRLSAESERRIGALALPVTRVEFLFSDLDPAAIQAFMTRFERAYQRGGG